MTLTSPSSTAAKELVLVPLHAAPHQAVAEIDALYDVYLDVIDKWNTDVGNPSPVPQLESQPTTSVLRDLDH